MSKRRRKDKTKGLVPETSKRKNNQKQKQYSKKEFKIKHNHNTAGFRIRVGVE